MKLIIGKPYLERRENKIRMCSLITQTNREPYVMWYEYDLEFEEYICFERSDAFLVNLLLYAMENGLDIISEQLISEKLYYNLVTYLIPVLSQKIAKYETISINCETDNSVYSPKYVGGSLSGGIDSFYTLLKHLDKDAKGYRITHLNFYNAGASGDYGGTAARELFEKRSLHMKKFAQEFNCDFVKVDTNANEFINQNFLKTHSLRTLSIPLSLQKLYKAYLFSSGYTFNECEINEQYIAKADLFICQFLSTENITFYSSGAEISRYNKVEYISQFSITYNKLNVCTDEVTNCSKCEKCLRTMLELHSMDKLGLYGEVFDLINFEKRRKHIMSHLIRNRKHEDYSKAYKILKKRHEIPLISYFLSIGWYIKKTLKIHKHH